MGFKLMHPLTRGGCYLLISCIKLDNSNNKYTPLTVHQGSSLSRFVRGETPGGHLKNSLVRIEVQIAEAK